MNEEEYLRQRIAEEDAAEAEAKKQQEAAQNQALITPPSDNGQLDQKPVGENDVENTEGDGETVGEAAANAQPQENPNEGWITQAGNFLSGLGDAPANWANQVTGGLIPSADEQREAWQESGPVGEAIVGGGQGIEAGFLSPATIAGRMTGQDTPWSRVPENLEGHELGGTMFNIMEVMTPTLILGTAAGPAAMGPVGLVAESALETGLQDNTDDLIAGRQIAQGYGEVAEFLGFDGAALTREMIEGRTPEAQVMNTVTGFIQNLGINYGTNAIIKRFFPSAAVADEATQQSVKLAPDGKTLDQVTEGVDNVQTPQYRPDHEPHEVMEIDNAVPVGRPSEGMETVSPDNLRRELMRKAGLGEDGLTSADRSYFTNYKALSDDAGMQRVIREVNQTLKKLPNFKDDLGLAAQRAAEFWNANKSLIDNNLDDLVVKFADPAEGIVKQTETNWEIAGRAFGDVESELSQNLGVTSTGYMVGALIGEELGVRMQKSAHSILNLDDAGIDFTEAMDGFVELQRKANLFYVPVRRTKREWAVGGYAQQRKMINALKDADVQTPGRVKPSETATMSGRDLTTIKVDETDVGRTMEELWTAAKEGDEDALETLKAYVGYIAYADPRASMSQVENLTGVLKRNLMKGNTKALGMIHYASMLSRLSTQVVSVSSGILRSVAEPSALIVDATLRKDHATRMYGLGQLWGGMIHMNDAFQSGIKAFKQNAPINGGTKFAGSYDNLAKRQADLEANFKGSLAEAQKAGEDTTSLVMSYHLQRFALLPGLQTPMRLLMAGDEVFKSTVGTQHATGRAWKRIAEMDGYVDEPMKQKIIEEEMQKVFKEGIETGKITDAEVLQDAKMLSFQRDIHQDRAGSVVGNVVDGAFNQIHEASSRNALFRIFQPFARISWDVNEQSGILLGGSNPLARWAQDQMPRYKAIMNGDDEVAKIRMRSMQSAGGITGMLAAAAATAGNLTGINSGGQPRQSIRIPGTDKWISYAKLEPFAATLSIYADAVNAFKYGAISRQEYEDVVGEMTMSFGLAFTDKSFMQGMFQMARMLSIKNYNEKSGSTIAELAGGFSPAFIRMIGEKIQPYKTIGDGSTDAGSSWAAFSQRAFGGVGLPVYYDPYSGDPIPRTGTMSDPNNYLAAVGSAMLQEMVPGRVTTYDPKDPVKSFFKEVGYQIDQEASIKVFNGTKLSAQEQSILSKDMHDYGNLRQNLEQYIKGAGKKDWNEFQKLGKKTAKSPEEAANNEKKRERLLQRIKTTIRSIHIKAKNQAISEGRLGQDFEFRNKMLGDLMSKSPMPKQPEPEANPVMDLVNWVNGSSSQQTA
jgi:hypothetical protein